MRDMKCEEGDGLEWTVGERKEGEGRGKEV